MKARGLGIAAIWVLSLMLLIPSCAQPRGDPSLPASKPLREGWTYTPSEDRVFEGMSRNFSARLQAVGAYLWFDGGSGGYTVPMRLNLETGTETAVCPDPLCAHDTPDCPLYGTRDFLALDDGSILALRQFGVSEMTMGGLTVTDRVHEITRFDPETGTSAVVEEFGDWLSLGPEVIVGNLRF